MKRTDPNRPDVVAEDGSHLHIAHALAIWEAGDFNDWACAHGFPIWIAQRKSVRRFIDMRGIEDALINFYRGPYDPRELE